MDFPIYQNGRYKIVPLTLKVIVKDGDKPIQTFNINDIESAIETVDDMAYRDGVRDHIAA